MGKGAGLVGGGLGLIRGRKGFNTVKGLYDRARDLLTGKKEAHAARLMARAEGQSARDVIRAENAWIKAQELAKKKAGVQRGMAEAASTKKGIATENAWTKAQEAARQKDVSARGAAEAQSARDVIKAESEFGKAQARRGKAGVPEGAPLSEAQRRAAAEAQIIKDQIAVEEAWKAAQAKTAAKNIPKEVKAATTAARVSKDVKGKTTMATNLGGKARPGPPPTPPDEIEAALKASLGGPKTGLAAERLRVGAEKAGGRNPLMTALTRDEAGPVMGEMRGTASPFLPTDVRGKIIDALRKLPPGPQREAYVARAKDVKTMRQVEAIRQDLEHLGLLVPAGLGVGALGGFDARRGRVSS
jgi:hypothetical protein